MTDPGGADEKTCRPGRQRPGPGGRAEPRDDTSVRRRAVLAALCCSGVVAGCAVPGSSPRSTERVTPAPIPTTDERGRQTVPPGAGLCPELPSNAEVYVCSPRRRDGDGLRLVPDRGPGTPTADRVAFALKNETSVAFRTGRDWWTLAALEGDDWSTTEQGAGTDRMSVHPGERFVWTLSGARVSENTEPLDVEIDPDRTGCVCAFVVTGYVAGGELTAIISPFRVSRD